jgi:hypothetical protein
MGRERFLFVPFPPPCGSALWDPDLSGRKSWRYSPECVEEEFSEVAPALVTVHTCLFVQRGGTDEARPL